MKRRKHFEKFFQITVGREVKQFIAHDLFYIIVLAVSGIMLLSWDSIGSAFGSLLSDIYQAVLLFTLICYSYLRLIRKKRYSEKEIRAIRLGLSWLLFLFGSAAFLLFGLFYVRDLGATLHVNIGFNVIDAIWRIGTFLAAVFALFKLFSDEHYYNDESAKSFASLFSDGLAWTGAVGGIGILAVLDVVLMLYIILRPILPPGLII